MDVFLRVKIQPVLEAQPAELLVHRLLLEETYLLRLLAVPLPVELDELVEEILSNLLQRLGHVDLSAKLRMHRQEWSAVKLLERAHKHYLDVFNSKHVEVTQVEFGSASVYKELAVNSFEVCLAIWKLCFNLAVASLWFPWMSLA